MIDTMFFLLVFFMAAALSRTMRRGLSVHLPRAATARDEIKQTVTLTLTKEERLYFNKEKAASPKTDGHPMRRHPEKNLLAVCLLLLFSWTECGASAGPAPDRAGARVRYARGFTITCHGHYKIVTVFEPGHAPRAKRLASFVLVKRGSRPPASAVPVNGTVIEIPVRRVVLRSASHVPFFSMLGLEDRIIAIAQTRYVNDPRAAGLIRQGRITEVGTGPGMAAQFDVEKLFALHPDLVLSWWTDNPAYAAHIKAKEAGLPVALLADYEESTPLGRTEWIKFIAAFFDAGAAAERVFDGIERRYLAMAAKTRNAPYRPTVMFGSSFRGAWYIAGGNSCFANLVKDAGGQYVWAADNNTGSRPINAETAIIRGKNADYWFTHSQNHCSLASIAAEDSRYKIFRSFQTGRVFSNNGKTGPGGGNDYYQGTMARPDLLLADMIAILHPERVPGHKLIWHVHLPPSLQDATADNGAREK